ncbi:MAG: oxidoreductase [Zoogloeaceae bacterium]|jgi:putative YhdH/YhfP family quinone oxidoreductase|nr:oxidoreductase [Zoogloeaceae bacterium]
MNAFTAYLIDQKDGKTVAGLTDFDEARLDKGEVMIRIAYSSVNYKDALAATGAGRIIRRYPCVGGIDMAGTVTRSLDPRFKEGDEVIATSYDIGVAHHGGYAGYGRVPADWVVPLPRGLSLFEAMALGTAGYTAALGITRMEENGLAPRNGKVIVSGATGGVGSIAIDILTRLGYHVVALTGKEDQSDYLKGLGAQEVMPRASLDLTKIKPLDKTLWAGAVDNLGGDVLAWIASAMQPDGVIASIGLAAGMNLNTTVAPFILRGVSLLGIDSGYTAMPLRRRVWERLAGDMRPARLADMTRTVKLTALPAVFDDFIAGRAHGRIVVDCAG